MRLLVLMEKGHKNLACVYQQKINYMHFKFFFNLMFFFMWSILSSYALKSHFRFVNCELSTFYIISMFESKKSGLSCFRQSRQSMRESCFNWLKHFEQRLNKLVMVGQSQFYHLNFESREVFEVKWKNKSIKMIDVRF